MNIFMLYTGKSQLSGTLGEKCYYRLSNCIKIFMYYLILILFKSFVWMLQNDSVWQNCQVWRWLTMLYINNHCYLSVPHLYPNVCCETNDQNWYTTSIRRTLVILTFIQSFFPIFSVISLLNSHIQMYWILFTIIAIEFIKLCLFWGMILWVINILAIRTWGLL